MTDHFYATIKVGSQLTSKPNVGMKAGYIVDYIDPDIYPFTDYDFGDQHLKAYAVIKLEKSKLDLIKPLVRENSPPVIPGDPFSNNYRQRSGGFKLTDLANLAGFPNLVEQWKGDSSIPVLDLRGSAWDTKIKFTNGFSIDDLNGIPDNNLVTSGTFTIGSGGDYATFAAFFADLGTATGNLIGRIISDVTESAVALMQTIMDAFDLTLDSNAPHLGDVTAGHTVSIAHNAQGIQIDSLGSFLSSNYTIKDFSAKRTVNGQGDAFVIFITTIVENLALHIMNNMFIDGGGFTGGGFLSKQVPLEIDRIAIRNCSLGFSNRTTNNVTRLFENSLVEGCSSIGINLASRSNFTCRNVAAYNNGTDWDNIENAIGIETGASDATNADVNWNTGTNNNPSLTPGNEIELNDTIPGYASHLSGGTVSGAAPTLSSVDMAGNTWDPQYPIGPKNEVAVAKKERNLKGNLRGNLIGGFQ